MSDECTSYAPASFSGHWRDWHRGHGCDKDDGQRKIMMESQAQDECRIYPCAACGVVRTKAEGGTVFTVCDECWERRHPASAQQPPVVSVVERRNADKEDYWNVCYSISYKGKTRCLWRKQAWDKVPTSEKALARFWDDTFSELWGFNAPVP